MASKNGMRTKRAAIESERLTKKSRDLIAKSVTLGGQSDAARLPANINRAEFMKTDLKVALTFVKIASQTANGAKRQRTQHKARIAYDTVQRHFGSASLSEADRAEIQSRLAELRAALVQLGEPV